MNNESNRMYMEQSHKNNTPTARFYNQVIDALGGMSPAKFDGYHDAIDGFPCIVYYNEGEVDANGNPPENVLVGSFMFNIDKEGKELGFECDLYDEHGEKIELKAKDKGVSPQEFVDSVANEIKRIWDIMNTSYDKFVRTSDPNHKEVVQLDEHAPLVVLLAP